MSFTIPPSEETERYCIMETYLRNKVEDCAEKVEALKKKCMAATEAGNADLAAIYDREYRVVCRKYDAALSKYYKKCGRNRKTGCFGMFLAIISVAAGLCSLLVAVILKRYS